MLKNRQLLLMLARQKKK